MGFNLILLGDCHGKFDRLNRIIKKFNNTNKTILQLGDLGVGFPKTKSYYPSGIYEFNTNDRFKFIRGNHDNPDECNLRSDYLGDYGILNINELKILFIGGGYSIDKYHRFEGIDYFTNEELTQSQSRNLLELLDSNKKFDLVITHESPKSIAENLLNRSVNSYTSKLLEEVKNSIEFDLWVFGHYHKSYKSDCNKFICLKELEFLEL